MNIISLLAFACTHIFVKVPLPGDREKTESSQAANCYYQSNYPKVEAIQLHAKDSLLQELAVNNQLDIG